MRKLNKLLIFVLSLTIGATFLMVSWAAAQVVAVEVDIKPMSCPNSLNVKGGGVLPVAILGTDDFDVTDVDTTTLQLEGVAALRTWFSDESTPVVDGEICECSEDSADGYLDLTAKFKKQDIVAALGAVSDGDVIVLTLTAMLQDGTAIMGEDCVLIRKRN
jgi:hypothetical protein